MVDDVSAGEGFVCVTELQSWREPAAWEHGVGDSLDWQEALDCYLCPPPTPQTQVTIAPASGGRVGTLPSGFFPRTRTHIMSTPLPPSSNASCLSPLMA